MKNDEWDVGETSSNWNFGRIYFKKDPYPKNDCDLHIQIDEKDYGNKNLHVVVAVWSTGNSFGYDNNHYAEIMSVHYDIKEAEKSKKILESDNLKTPVILGNGYRLHYAPWDGYFDSLSYIEIV